MKACHTPLPIEQRNKGLIIRKEGNIYHMNAINSNKTKRTVGRLITCIYGNMPTTIKTWSTLPLAASHSW